MKAGAVLQLCGTDASAWSGWRKKQGGEGGNAEDESYTGSQHAYGRVVVHVRMGRVSRMNDSYCMYELFIFPI